MSKDGKKPRKGSGLIDSLFVEFGSFADMVRNAWGGSSGANPVYAVNRKDGFRFFAIGMKMESGGRIIMYCDSDKCDNFIVYRIGMSQEEKIEFRPVLQMESSVGTYIMPVIMLKQNPFVEMKKKPEMRCIAAKDGTEVVKAVMGKSISGGIGKVYSFKYNGKRYIGSFNVLIGVDDIDIFSYAEAPTDKLFSFFRYNYTDGNMETTDTFGEHGFLYVKVVNLKEPFPFFKPE
jgi:hypothetical protein